MVLSFFFTVPATTELYTLSLHDALPISTVSAVTSPPCAGSWTPGYWASSTTPRPDGCAARASRAWAPGSPARRVPEAGRSEEHTSELHHVAISYAVFCLKKKTDDRIS